MYKFIILFFMTTNLFASSDFDWQGHRGARGLYPENTINGMKLAAEFAVTTLELDVVVSKDNKVVVSHEPWMSEAICLGPKGKSVKDKKINLYKLSYSEIQKYDCGSKKYPRFPQQKNIKELKPLLSDLLAAFKDSKFKFNIEIKSNIENEKKGFQPKFKEMSDLVVAEVAKVLSTDRYMIQSFDWRVLKHIHEVYPNITLSALRGDKYQASEVIKELGFTPNVFSPDWTLVTSEDVKYFHTKNIKVIPWTVNATSEMNRLIALGVDGIITDYPNLIIELASECPKNFNRFEGACVRVPKHAEASVNNPGWVCETGYLQKRNSCVKIKIPKHAILLEDGKTWVCREGYERYRYSCKKKK